MYFFKKKGKQHVDLSGQLILTYNPDLVRARIKSAGPVQTHNARYIKVAELSFMGKVRACGRAINFIFSKPEPLEALVE